MRPARSATFAVLALAAKALLASEEDDATACVDGIDNDFDRSTDCSDVTCRSSSETCSLLDGPIVIGIGQRAAVRFDVPMRTLNPTVVPPPG